MKHALLLIASAALSAALAVPALASDRRKGDDLPGVTKDFRLVKPMAEAPEAEKFVKDDEGFVQIGENTRMKISGLIRYDINFSTREGRRHRHRR
jgi:hypothetical protein